MRVIVVHQCNKGVGAARNAGVKIASGEWISFIDSDDTIEPQMLEKLVSLAEDNQAKLAMCTVKHMSKDGVVEATINDRNYDLGAIEVFNSNQMIEKQRWAGEYDNALFVIVCNKIFKRELLGENPFVEGIIHEDEMFANTLYLRDYQMVILHEPLYNYRSTPGSIMHQIFNSQKSIVFEIFLQRYDLFIKHGYLDAARAVAKIFVEVYIDYYFLACESKHTEWVTKYSKQLKKYLMMQESIIPGWLKQLKFSIRYFLFLLMPQLYYTLLRKRKALKTVCHN